VQVVEDEIDHKKKAKGGKPAETLAPTYSRGWVDFTPLMVPGRKHTIQRILLKACPPPVLEAEGDNEAKEGEDDEEKEPEQIFDEPQTYIYVHISTEFAINPSIIPGEEEAAEEPSRTEGEGESEGDKEKQAEPVTEQPPADDLQLDNSFVEEEETIEDSKPKVIVDKNIKEEVNPNFGYFASTSDTTANFRVIIQKYLKKISDHYSIVMAPDEVEQKANSKMATIPTHATSAQRQKKIEKYIMQCNKMYTALKKEMKIAIHRIIRDKYHKSVNHEGLDKQGRAAFIAQLYTYLVQQIRTTLETTVNLYKDKIHEDLIEDLIATIQGEKQQRDQAFTEDYLIKLERLAEEYENIGNFKKAESFYKKLILNDKQNVRKLLNIARFSMKIGKIDQGYEYFRMAKEADPNSKEQVLAFAGILIERERYTEGRRVLNEILDGDFNHCHSNILLSLINEAYKRPGLVRKHIAIAKVQRMRELEIIPKKIKEIPNLNEINYKLERPNWGSIVTKDQNMDAKENDKLFSDVIEFMLGHNLTKVAANLLKYIQNQDSDRYRLNFARVKHQLHEYSVAVETLDKILTKNENHPAALILRGD
jgi:tetratricopeptide (TPR) repeat protein